MNVFGVLSVIVLLFVTYKFLSMVYNMADRRYREGYKNCAMEPSQYGGNQFH